MLQNKLIMFNGPPRSGKDTAVNHLVDAGIIIQNLKFAKEVKERTHALYGLYAENGKPRHHSYYEDVKDQPHPDFLGISPRDAYINTSEKLMKPVHGNAVWAKFLADTMEDKLDHDQPLGISDVGFTVELEHFVERFNVENLILFRIFRQGTSYENDSREYVKVMEENGHPTYKGLVYIDIVNNGTVEDFLNTVRLQTEIFINELDKIPKYN